MFEQCKKVYPDYELKKIVSTGKAMIFEESNLLGLPIGRQEEPSYPSAMNYR
jgi:hypothetical protein